MIAESRVARLLLVLGCLAAAQLAGAESTRVDRRIAYQGQTGVAPGPATLAFSLFDDSGLRVWGPENHAIDIAADGRFAAVLGSTGLDTDPEDGVPDLDALEPGRGLELDVVITDGAGLSTALTPRTRLFASFHAELARSVTAEAISTRKIRSAAVTSRAIHDGSITGSIVLDGSVQSHHIRDGSIEPGDIRPGSILSTDVGLGAVTSAKIEDRAIEASLLATGLPGSKLAESSVTRDKLADDNGVSGLQIEDRKVLHRHLQPGFALSFSNPTTYHGVTVCPGGQVVCGFDLDGVIDSRLICCEIGANTATKSCL